MPGIDQKRLTELEIQVQAVLSDSSRSADLLRACWDRSERSLPEAQALARLLFDLWRSEPASIAPDGRSTPAATLLDRFVWSPQESIFQGLPGAEDRFGPFTPRFSGLDEAAAFLRMSVSGSDSWQARVLFPTCVAGKEPGQLIWANVRTVRRPEPDASPVDAIVIAPWSRYVPFRLGELETRGASSDFHDLQQNLIGALESQIPEGTSEVDRPRRVFYLIDLEPLDVGDFEPGFKSQDVRSKLTPGGFEVEGPSLGLAIFLAAWAALHHHSLVPIIATGTIAKSKEADTHDEPYFVGPVGGLEVKARAIKELAMGRRILFFAPPPKEGAREEPDTSDAIRYRSLSSFLDQDNLTDGFDSYRRMIGMGSAAGLPLSPLPVDRDDSSDSRGYSPRDQADIEATASALVDRLLPSASDGSIEQERFTTLTVPFGEDPRLAAFALAGALVRDHRWKTQKERWGNLALVLPVDLARLSEGPGGSVAALAADLSRILRDAIPDSLRPQYPDPTLTEQSLANALRSPGKLLLVAYGAPSLDLWERLHTNPAPHRRAIARLQLLAGATSRSDIPWKPQRVVVICSDVHHQQSLNSEREPTRTA